MRTLLLIPSLLLLNLSFSPAADQAPPSDWDSWSRWAESLHPITDAEGHGPDIGSEEWAQALGRRLGIDGPEGQGPDLRSGGWRGAVEKKLMAKGPAAPRETRELLSTHQTEARFDGIHDHRCRGLTSLCPDGCGHSGKLATFSIIRYVHYNKPGEYGDPQQETFQVLVEDNHKKPKIPNDIRDAILDLKPGTPIRLNWDHEYVTNSNGSFPERPIRLVAPLPVP